MISTDKILFIPVTAAPYQTMYSKVILLLRWIDQIHLR